MLYYCDAPVNPDIILLDFDDTLISSVAHNVYGWQKSAIEAGLPPKDIGVWRSSWGGKPTDLVLKVYDHGITEEKAREVLRIQQERIATEKSVVPPIPGALEAVRALADRYTLGIVTSREQGRTDDPAKFRARDGRPLMSLLEYRIDSSGFDLGDFTLLVGSDENPYHKPDPRVFLRPAQILDEIGLGIRNATYVGDDVADYLAARDAGLQFVAVLSGVRTWEDFSDAGCPFDSVIPSVARLPDLDRMLRRSTC